MDGRFGIFSRLAFNWRSALDIATSLVLIAAAVTLVLIHQSNASSPQKRPGLKVPSKPLSIGGAPSKGLASAPVVMITFSDFQCPFCGRFAREVLPRLEVEYVTSGRVQLVHRHFPLPNHEHAVQAAQAAECANAQGRFWPMHDRLFGAGAELDGASLRSLAASLDLNHLAFEACLDNASTLTSVLRDSQEARSLGVVSTPSFLIGSRLPDGRVQVSRAFSGALPLNDFRAELDRAIRP